MYSEQMMREQGFDAGPTFRLSCTPTRSGGPAGSSSTSGCIAASSSVEEADRLPRRADRLRAAQRRGPRSSATPRRPTYQLSLPAGQGPAPPAARRTSGARLGDAFSAAPLPRRAARQRQPARSASIAGCSPARAARRRGLSRGPADRPMQVIPSDRPRRRVGRGSSSGRAPRPASGRPTDRPERIAAPVRRAGRTAHPPRRLRRGASRPAGQPRGHRAGRLAASRRRSSSPAASRAPTRSGWPSRPARPGSSCAMSVVEEPELLRDAIAVAGDWLAVGLDPRPERLRRVPLAAAPDPDASTSSSTSSSAAASAGSSSATAARSRTLALLGAPGPGPRHRPVRGRRRPRPRRDRSPARCRRERHHSGRGAPVRGDRLPAAREAAA